jgi:hypothetical protein
MLHLLSSITATGLLIVCGLLHGRWTDRWRPSAEPAKAAAHLRDVAMILGEWEGQDIEVKPSSVDATLAGSLQRRYVNQRTGHSVLVALVCGRHGPVSIHTPDVCYDASGFQVGSRSRVTAPEKMGEFWCADAVRTRVTDETRLRIFWSWNHGHGWNASEDARIQFARQPVLFKLYVIRDLAALNEKPADDPTLGFMEVFLPELDRALFAPSARQ